MREVLHAHIPTITPESTVRDAVDKMDIYQFPALVVVDKHLKVLGVVTEGDLCRGVAKHDNLTRMGSDPAFAYASTEPVTLPPDADIGDAFHRMLSSGLTILPIVEDDRLFGVALRVDLMQAMLLDSEPGGNS